MENMGSVTLTCVPPKRFAAIRWFRDSNILSDRGRGEVSPDHRVLTLQNITRNEVGLNQYGSDVAVINPIDSTFVVGSNLTLSCFASSNPPAEYTWMVDGSPGATGQLLSILDVSLNSSGLCHCHAANIDTDLWSMAQLAVHIKVGRHQIVEALNAKLKASDFTLLGTGTRALPGSQTPLTPLGLLEWLAGRGPRCIGTGAVGTGEDDEEEELGSCKNATVDKPVHLPGLCPAGQAEHWAGGPEGSRCGGIQTIQHGVVIQKARYHPDVPHLEFSPAEEKEAPNAKKRGKRCFNSEHSLCTYLSTLSARSCYFPSRLQISKTKNRGDLKASLLQVASPVHPEAFGSCQRKLL
ncbi:hypothetical protein HPG69_009208 [Diceros bicornis minor]|uniref:Ig-like domain-containing protein n=1 Tax=Diceros bicornis minor TaxID=77932 RepID=A0A7J7EZS0_DICBM|nr:hypothetical protein HPG69_009208 [Diceros bicornis minor]